MTTRLASASLVILLVLIWGGGALASEPPKQVCHAALHVVSEAIRSHQDQKAWVVDDPRYLSEDRKADAPNADNPKPLSTREWLKDWRGDKPSRELAAATPPPAEQRVSECPALHIALKAQSVEFGRAARDRRDEEIMRGRTATSIIEVATPILSASGNEALVQVGVFLPWGGYVNELHLRRSKAGRWKTTSVRNLVVS